MVKYMAVAVAVAVAVSGGGAMAVAVAVAGLTKRFFNHIQKDFLNNVWVYKKLDPQIPRLAISFLNNFSYQFSPGSENETGGCGVPLTRH